MTEKNNDNQSVRILENAAEQQETRQVASGLVAQGEVILPLGAGNIPAAEDIPLVPLTMSEEKTCGAKEVGIATLSGSIGGFLGYVAADACFPGASLVAHATTTALSALGCSLFGKSATVGCIKACGDSTPPALRF